MGAITTRGSSDLRVELNRLIAERRGLEREIETRTPLIGNAHLREPRLDQMRSQIGVLKSVLIDSIVAEHHAERDRLRKQLAKLKPAFDTAEAQLAGDRDDLTGRELAAARDVKARFHALEEKLTDAQAAVGAVKYHVDAL